MSLNGRIYAGERRAAKATFNVGTRILNKRDIAETLRTEIGAL